MPGTHTCQFCGRHFMTMKKLRDHIRDEHTKPHR